MSGTVLQVKHNGEIVLPSIFRDKANLHEGDLLEAVLEVDGTVRLIPQKVKADDQAYFWTRRWQEGELEADEDLQKGNFEKFENMDDALRFLDERDERG